MRFNVLHLLGTAQPEGTGIAKAVVALARGLPQDRFSLHAWFLGGEGPLADVLRAQGADVRVVAWHGGTRDPRGAWRLWRALRSLEVAIVHQHFGGRSVRTVAGRATGGAIVSQLWGRVSETVEGRPATDFRLLGADEVIATSRAVGELVIGRGARLVYPGIHFTSEIAGERSDPESAVLGTAGRLAPIKGLVYLVRAVAALRTNVPRVRLEIAGSGPERGRLEREAERLGVADRVSFLGWLPDVQARMTRWDVFVQPSLEENFPIAALDAMAAGLPVVATTVGGIPELVEDGRTGWLVAPGDADALAERLRSLLLDANMRCAMGKAGQARVKETFTADRMVADVAAIYEELLSRTTTAKAVSRLSA